MAKYLSPKQELQRRIILTCIVFFPLILLLKLLYPHAEIFWFFTGILLMRVPYHMLIVKQKFIEPLERVDLKKKTTTITMICVGSFVFLSGARTPESTPDMVMYVISSLIIAVVSLWILMRELETEYNRRSFGED